MYWQHETIDYKGLRHSENRLLDNYHSRAEMCRDIEILIGDHDTAKEAITDLLNGACVYTSAEMQELIDSPDSWINEDRDEDEREENKEKYQAFFDGSNINLDCWGRVQMHDDAVFIDKEGNLHKRAGLEWVTDSFEKFCDNFCLDEEEPESAEYWQQVKEMLKTHEPLKDWEIAEIKADTYFIAYVL